jgi:hypothetical protein
MKTIMKNLTGALLVAAAALATAQPQSAARELSISDIKAQWPPEAIFASDFCQHVREDPRKRETGMRDIQTIVFQRYVANPKTFVPDLHTLMEKSDEVILVGVISHDSVLSPSGRSVATYDQARVIHSWKGPHHAGDVLVFGMPYGIIDCTPTPSPTPSMPKTRFELGGSLPATGPYLYVLFLRQANGDETRVVQGLFSAAGEGTQGMFMIPVPELREGYSGDYCIGSDMRVNGKPCYAAIENNQSPVKVLPDTYDPPDPNAPDPLFKKYNGMPASDFLKEVQAVAAQALAEESSPR